MPLDEQWRPWCCPEPRCVPLHTVQGEEQPLSTASPGESFVCFGKGPMIEYVYDGHEHRNDTRSCHFTPNKGLIAYQENADDWRAMASGYNRALKALELLPVSAGGEVPVLPIQADRLPCGCPDEQIVMVQHVRGCKSCSDCGEIHDGDCPPVAVEQPPEDDDGKFCETPGDDCSEQTCGSGCKRGNIKPGMRVRVELTGEVTQVHADYIGSATVRLDDCAGYLVLLPRDRMRPVADEPPDPSTARRPQ